MTGAWPDVVLQVEDPIIESTHMTVALKYNTIEKPMPISVDDYGMSLPGNVASR